MYITNTSYFLSEERSLVNFIVLPTLGTLKTMICPVSLCTVYDNYLGTLTPSRGIGVDILYLFRTFLTLRVINHLMV